MFWTPKAHRLGDPTILRVGDEYHLFTEQFPLEATDDPAGKRTVGHALSNDLFEWEELPPAIACGPPGAFDGYSIYHMDVTIHKGKWYMFYTGLDKGGPGQQQAIGLATSEDGIHWQKHPANPILRADARWYESAIPDEATYQKKDRARLWFRDPCVIQDSRSGQFGMAVVARDKRHHPDVRGCLAWATSNDLVHWEPHPPLYSPGRFHTIETPSLFEHDGRHYLIFMTHSSWGPPVMATDPYQTGGDFYAISESGWKGPYHQPPDEVLIAAHGEPRMGAARLVQGPQGEFFLYGWLRMDPRGDDVPVKPLHTQVLPPPRRVRFRADGQMQVVYYDRIERFCQRTGIAPGTQASLETLDRERWLNRDGVWGKHLGGRTVALFPGRYRNFIFSARVEFRRGECAGLVVRADETGSQGWRVVANRRFGRVEFGTLQREGFLDARLWPKADVVDLKVIAYGPSVEVYADERLMIHQVRYREEAGRIGYLVEQAEARFSQPKLLVFTR